MAGQQQEHQSEQAERVEEDLPYILLDENRCGYGVDPRGRICYNVPEHLDENEKIVLAKYRVVMDGWIVINEIRRNRRTGETQYILQGKDIFGKTFELQIPSDKFYDQQNKLLAIVGPRFNIKTGFYLKKGKDNLRNVIQQVTSEKACQEKTIFDQIGWVENKLVFPGREPSGYSCELMDSRLPYDLSGDYDLWTGLEALKYIIQSCPIEKIMPLVILVFISPVIGKLFPNDRYGYAIIGETQSLKTAVCRLLLRIYGNGFDDKNTMIKFGDEGTTPTALQSIAAMAGVMPLMLDNFKSYKAWSDSSLMELIHALLEGADKAKMSKKDGSWGLKAGLSFLNLLLITGEDYNLDPASIARVMKIDWEKPDLATLDKATPDMREQLPAIGQTWLDWLETDSGIKAMNEMKAGFWDRRKEIKKMIEDLGAGGNMNLERVATNATLEQFGFELMCKHPVYGKYFMNFAAEYNKAFGTHVHDIVGATADSSEALKFVDVLKEGIACGDLLLNDPGIDQRGRSLLGYGKIIAGWETNEEFYGDVICIIPSRLDVYMGKHLHLTQNLSMPAIASQLIKRKLLIPDKENKTKQSKQNPYIHKKERVYVFYPCVFG